MFENNTYLKLFTDMISEGFIFIDENGIIQLYNDKAKEIFGIIYNEGEGHPKGKIEKGDIVIIADNSLGRDDGGLGVDSLDILGIRDDKINQGDSLIAAGVVFGDNQPVYKHTNSENKNLFELNTVYLGNEIYAGIDFNKRFIDIRVNGKSYVMNYINSIGHMVVLDGRTMKVKFYQAKGYTARGESICDLFAGNEFMAKGENTVLDVIGKRIFDIHDESQTIIDFYNAATGKDINFREKFTEINEIPTLCSIIPINVNNKRVGAVMKVEDITELKKVLRQRDEALSSLERVEKQLREEDTINETFSEILGDSEEIRNVKKIAYRASKSNSTILLLGESGTGKSLLARSIHNASRFKDNPFIHVNCSVINESILESELFGYEGGAFTGARSSGKIGLFEAANGGTIFLDEIGEISPSIQVKLLQFLQSQSFFRVGGVKEIKVSVRIIAATNKNLEEEMLRGNFREDLFYRINVFPIWLPPLRNRKSDIHQLVYSILPRICKRVGCEEKRISGEALQLLNNYDWPGNIRELENIIERAVIMTEGSTIFSSSIAINRRLNNRGQRVTTARPLKDAVEEAEKRAIEDAISIYEGSREKAMEALKIGKTSFYEKIKKYQIKIK